MKVWDLLALVGTSLRKSPWSECCRVLTGRSGSNTPLVPWQGIISTQIPCTEGGGRVVPQRKIRMFLPEEG